MKDNYEIKHEGYISKITSQTITVSLKGNVNCDGCKAQSACGVSDSNDKEIEIFETNSSFKLNESVELVLKKQLGLKAVFWAYVFPFILMLLVLIIASGFLKEWMAGLLSLLVLLPYYLIIYKLNSFFEKVFKIEILKI
ncbi:SoxR reducing system RseC family protein [Lutibacter sp.]